MYLKNQKKSTSRGDGREERNRRRPPSGRREALGGADTPFTAGTRGARIFSDFVRHGYHRSAARPPDHEESTDDAHLTGRSSTTTSSDAMGTNAERQRTASVHGREGAAVAGQPQPNRGLGGGCGDRAAHHKLTTRRRRRRL